MDPFSIIIVGLIGTVVLGATYTHWKSNYSAGAKRERFLKQMELSGIPENQERALAIRQRDADIQFRLIEGRQAADILNNKNIRRKLERADIDVEELQLLIMAEDDITKLLEE
jgi:hypothetical protein